MLPCALFTDGSSLHHHGCSHMLVENTTLHAGARRSLRVSGKVITVVEPGLTRQLAAAAGQGSITVPGAIAASPVEAPIDVEEGSLPSEVPVAYFHGGASPADNPELYDYLVERLAQALDRRVSLLRCRARDNAGACKTPEGLHGSGGLINLAEGCRGCPSHVQPPLLSMGRGDRVTALWAHDLEIRQSDSSARWI